MAGNDPTDQEVDASLADETPEAREEERLKTRREKWQPSREEQAVVALWDKRRDSAAKFCQPFFLDAQELVAYYLGYQWLIRPENDDVSSAGFALIERRPNAEWEVQVTQNYYQQHVNARRARMLIDEPKAAARPATEDDDAVQAAAVAQQFLDVFDTRWDAQRKYQNLVSTVVATGLAWMLDRWDENAQGLLEEEGENGKSVPVRGKLPGVEDEGDGEQEPGGEREAAGDVTTDTVAPWLVAWEPGAGVRDAGFYVRDVAMTVRDVRDAFGEQGELVDPSGAGDRTGMQTGTQADSELQSSLLKFIGGSGGGAPEAQSEWVTVHQGFERLGSGEDARWRCVAWCQNVLLRETECEYQPLVPVVYDEMEGTPFPVGLGRQLKGVQDRINVLTSKIHRHMNLLTQPKVLKHVTTNLLEGAMSDKPGEHVEWSGEIPPAYLAPTPLNREVYDERLHLIGAMGELSGVHEVSQAKAPTGVKSGKAINLLQQQDSTNAQHSVANLKAALRRHYRNLIAIARAYYVERRWLDVVGEDTELDVRGFIGDDLAGVGDIRLRVGTAIPLMPSEKRQLVMDMQAAGLNEPGREMERARFLEQLGFGEPEASPTMVMRGRKAARREHALLEREGRIDPPYEFEPHAVHQEEHEKFMQTGTFKRLPQVSRDLMLEHWQLTRVGGLMGAVRAAQEDMLIQSGGMPALPPAGPEQGMLPGPPPNQIAGPAPGPEVVPAQQMVG